MRQPDWGDRRFIAHSRPQFLPFEVHEFDA